MSDPIESSQPEIIARILGALTLILGAMAGFWRTIFGSRKERTDASERAAEIALRAAEHADERARIAGRDFPALSTEHASLATVPDGGDE